MKHHGYRVDIETTLISDDCESDGCWYAVYQNRFNSVTKTNGVSDITSTIVINPGEECYVVWAEWSSGDSFGTGDNSSTEALAIFTDKKSADIFVKVLENTREYSKKIITPDKQSHSVQCGWVGYFESLTAIHIESTIMR